MGESVITKKYSAAEIEEIRDLYRKRFWQKHTSAHGNQQEEWVERVLSNAMMAGLSVQEVRDQVNRGRRSGIDGVELIPMHGNGGEVV